MARDEVDPTVGERGEESHPAFGLIGASRTTVTPGVHLFDSDIRHQHTVRVRLKTASRRRDLHHDWIHADTEIVEVELSEAQWASFVSSMNSGDGVPCTIRWRADGGGVPEFPYDPRLAHTTAETKDAANLAFGEIRAALAVVEALDAKCSAKDRREAMRELHFAIVNASPNVEYAGKVLIEHTEDVIQKARADVEAFVVGKARQLGIDPVDMGGGGILEIEGPRPDVG